MSEEQLSSFVEDAHATGGMGDFRFHSTGQRLQTN